MNRLARLFSLAALRRYILLLLTLLLTAPLPALTEGNFTYEVSNGQATITDFPTSYSGALTIPSTLGGYPVTSIGRSAFSYCSSLTSVMIPEGVTSIGDRAFYNCYRLTSITIPDSVTSIGDAAFAYCSSLTSVTIPESVTSIGSSAFYGCSSLTSVTIPLSVTSIASAAFFSCSSLTSVTIPEGVTTIGYRTFYGCSSLTSVTIPSSVTSIGDEAFSGVAPEVLTAPYVPSGMSTSRLTELIIPEGVTSIGSYAFLGCSSLTSVMIPASVTSIGDGAFAGCSSLVITVSSDNTSYASLKGSLFNKDYSAILAAPSVKGDYIIPEGVTTIGDYAFENCSSLTSVTIPESVTSIGASVFGYCSSLTSVTIPTSVTSIGSYAFYKCSSLTSVEIPASVTEIGEGAFTGVAPKTLVASCVPSGMSTEKLTSVTIPSSVTAIGDWAFYDCRSLTSVTIPSSVTAIGDWAFYDCRSLTSVTIPSSVTSIKNGAFRGCSSLISVTIPEGVTSIGDWAFYDCRSLTSVTIPSSVTSIENGAFRGCSSLISVTIPEGVTSIGDYAFENCSSLSSVTIPEDVTSIGYRAFAACSSLTSVTIPASVTAIGNEAFRGCSSLISVTIPEGVTSIGDYAFENCSSLSSVTIPEGVTSIGNCAFSGCSSLTSVMIPEGVTSIGYQAFYYCSSLTSITIPDSVTSIGGSAFKGCSSLTLVTIPEGVTSIGYRAFDDCTSLTSVTIPESVTSIGDYAFYNCSSLTSVTIPEGVTSIGNYAFSDCTSLTSVEIPTSVTSIGDEAFYKCTSLTSVTISSSVSSIGGWVFDGCSSLTSVTIPEGVTTIGDGAFSDCSSLTSVTIPESVTSIGDGAFSDCSSLTSVTIPESVTSIGEGAFTGVAPKTLVASYVPSGMSKEKLTSVTIPEGVTSIGSSAFEGCSSLTSVTIPEGVTSIGYEAFYYCSSLTSVTIPSSVTSIGNWAFWGVAPKTLVASCVPSGMSKENLTSVTIPEGVTSIGYEAFYDCGSLTSVTIPASVTSIGTNAFYWVAPEVLIASRFPAGSGMSATKLSTIIVPEGTETIAAGAFEGCSAVTSVVIPASVTEMGEGAFTGVAPTTLVAPFLPSGMSTDNLTEVTLTTAATVIPEAAFAGNEVLRSIVLPAGVTAIGARAFEGCSALERVEIPASVTEIGAGAFRECTGLTEVVFAEGLEKVGDKAFEGCSALEWVEIPASVTEIGARAFAECTGLTEVVFAEGLKTIGDEAFWGCSAVEEMVLPASLTTLGKRVFTRCNRVLVAEENRNYKSVDGVLFSANNEWLLHFPVYRGGEYATPVNVHFVGEEAFMGNTALNFVYLADITTLEPRVFKDCGGLIYCFATDGLLTIQANAFENATSLRAFTVPATVSLLQVGAFKNCTSLSLVAFRGTVPRRTGTVFSGMNLDQMRSTYPSEYAATWEAALDGSLMWDGLKMVADSYYTGTSGNYKYRALGGEAIITGSTIPLSGAVRLPMMLDDYLVTGIDARAFVTSTGLTDITFPRSLLSIGDYAFAFCTKLQSVTFEGCPLTKGSTPTQPFPADTTAIGNYPAELEEAWSQVIEGGYYYGLRMGLVEVLAILGDGEGEVRGTGTYHIGETVTLEAIPARGQRFVRWMFLNGTTSTTNPISFTADEACYVMVTFKKDPTAVVFSKITYENLMGATHRNPATYEEGTEYTFTTPSEVTGYTFQGWQPAAINSAMTGDQTIRATWKANGYTVIYASNGGMGSMENTSAVYDTPFSLSANAFTRVGYTFAGWATSATGGALYADGAEVSNLTATANGTVTLYAVWEKREIHLRSAVAKQRFPWNGVVDVAITLEDDGLLAEHPEDYAFRLRAVDQVSQEVYVPSAEALMLTVPTSGAQQLTWDVARDYPELVSRELSFTVEVVEASEEVIASVRAEAIAYDATVASRVIGASEVSALSYSPAWAGGDTVRITINGELWHTDTQAGEKAWAPEESGYYSLTHETLKEGVVIETLTATVQGASVQQVATPILTIRGDNVVLVTSETEGATLYYTVDGSEPTEQSPTVTNFLLLSGSGTLKVRAMKEGWIPSTVVTYEHTSVGEGNVESLLRQGSVAWQEVALDGTQVWQSGAIGDDGTSAMSLTLTGPGTLTFQWSVSSESGWDWLSFLRDGNQIGQISGTQDWQTITYSKTDEATATFTWQYTKDGSVSSGSDCGWVDTIRWTGAAPLQAERCPYDSVSQLYYALTNSEVTILSYEQLPEDGHLELPAVIAGAPVTAIADYAFANDTALSSVTLPATVRAVGDAAFSGCTSLTSVTFLGRPCVATETSFVEGAAGIYPAAYAAEWEAVIVDGTWNGLVMACSEAEEDPPEAEIFTYAVSNGGAIITGLTTSYPSDLTIPTTLGGYPVTAIGDSAFQGCSSLTSVTIPEGVTSIGDSAFRDCSSLTSVTISESVTSIGEHTFWNTPWYYNLPTDAYGVKYESDARKVLVEAPDALAGAYVVPSSVRMICDGAFNFCGNLSSIIFPEGMTAIGDGAFLFCDSLTSVTFLGRPCEAGNPEFSTSATGIYPAAYAAEWEAVIVDGKWNGLVMACSEAEEDPPEAEIFTYSVSNSEATITDFPTSYSGALTIPSTLGGYPVTKIGYDAFSVCSSLTSVVIPASVTSIGDDAFRGCSALTSVVIPASVTSIGYGAFRYCNSLTSVVIPAGVTKIGDSAFSGCRSLTSVTILEGVTEIGRSAFSRCSSLTSVTILEGMTSIGWYAFQGCSALTSVTIPASVTSIGNQAFEGVAPATLVAAAVPNGMSRTNLISVTIPEGVTSIGAFSGCSSLTSVTIPASVTSIGGSAFSGCSSLTSVTIPASVTSIGNGAFASCTSLIITVDPRNPSYASRDGCLFNTEYTTLLAAPGVTGDYVIPSSVTSIGDAAFWGCRSLTSVVIPEGVTSIGTGAFHSCSALTSLVIPEGVTAIGYRTFEGCSSLSSVTIPASVTSIGDYAFQGCSSLTSVTIPSSVTTISWAAFSGCSSLTSVEIPEGVTSIGNFAFLSCSALTSVLIPEGVTSIGERTFDGCSSLSSVTIPASVTDIGNWAFEGVAPATLVAAGVPNGMSRTNLTSVVIPEGVTSIGYRAFYGCSSLTSVVIPEGVTSIGERTFEGCSSLSSVTIPASVTSIGNRAFEGCSSLTSVTFLGEPCAVGESAFPVDVTGFYPTQYAAAWEEEIADDGTWNGLKMECVGAEAKPTVTGDEGATIEGSAEEGWTVKPSGGVKDVVISIPEGVEAAKVTVEVPSTATSVTANGATIKVVKVDGTTRYDITNFLDFTKAGEGRIDLSKVDVQAQIAKAILDTSEAGGAVFDPSAEKPLTTAETKPGLTYVLLEGDSLDRLTEGARTVGDGQPWSPTPTKRGPSAFYRIRISK